MRKLRKVGKGTSSHPTYLKFPPCFLVSFMFSFNNYLHCLCYRHCFHYLNTWNILYMCILQLSYFAFCQPQ